MFRHLSYTLTTICIFFCFSQAATVSGTITDTISGKALAGATVDLYDYEAITYVSDTTGVDGTYSFDNIPSGDYTIDVNSEGCIAKSFDTTIGDEASIAINFMLFKIAYSKVSGVITDSSTGIPISGVIINCYQNLHDFTLITRTDTSDANGAYNLDSLSSDSIDSFTFIFTDSGYRDTIYQGYFVNKDPLIVNIAMTKGLSSSVRVNLQNHTSMNFTLSKNGIFSLANISEPGILKLFSLDGKQIFSYSFDRNCSTIPLPQNIRSHGTAIIAEIKLRNNKLTHMFLPSR